MLINLEEMYANIKDEIDIDNDVVFDDKKYTFPDIKGLKDVHLNGKIQKNSNDQFVLIGTLKGIMTILDTISLDERDYSFIIELDEELDKIMENNKKAIDIIEILWQNIVLEVPLRYTEVSDYSKYSGDGWKLISEDELVRTNNPFSSLLENEKEE